MGNLPNKLSELVRVALHDLKKTEANEDYVIDMACWHEPEGEIIETEDGPTVKTICRVCLAGSVLAQTMGTEFGQTIDTDDFSTEDHGKMLALDAIRSGALFEAVDYFYGYDQTEYTAKAEWISERFGKDYVSYNENPEAFKTWLEDAANQLGGVGL